MNIYNIRFDPNGGDLGRAFISNIEPLEFSVVLPHVAFILESLHQLDNSRLPYVYAFEFYFPAKKGIELVINSFKLPEHVQWYETDGLRIFEIRGSSGGVATKYICYLITKTQ